MDGPAVRNVVATLLALMALLLAAITVSAILSGVDGLLVVVVGAAGCGAVLLGVIAAWLRFSSGSDYTPVLSSVRSRQRTDHKIRARLATPAAEPKSVPPPLPPIQPAAPTSPTVPRPRAQDRPARDDTPPARAARTPGGRRFILGVGLVVVFTGIQDIRTGKAQLAPRGEGASRAQQPLAFWTVVLLKLGFGGALVSVAVRDALLARRQRQSGD